MCAHSLTSAIVYQSAAKNWADCGRWLWTWSCELSTRLNLVRSAIEHVRNCQLASARVAEGLQLASRYMAASKPGSGRSEKLGRKVSRATAQPWGVDGGSGEGSDSGVHVACVVRGS